MSGGGREAEGGNGGVGEEGKEGQASAGGAGGGTAACTPLAVSRLAPDAAAHQHKSWSRDPSCESSSPNWRRFVSVCPPPGGSNAQPGRSESVRPPRVSHATMSTSRTASASGRSPSCGNRRVAPYGKTKAAGGKKKHWKQEEFS